MRVAVAGKGGVAAGMQNAGVQSAKMQAGASAGAVQSAGGWCGVVQVQCRCVVCKMCVCVCVQCAKHAGSAITWKQPSLRLALILKL